MKIIIIGAGFTGFQLARRLVAEKNDVVLIDKDEETVRYVSNRVDCLVTCANGNSLETLESAGIAKAQVLVALTESDELNLITCSMVDAVYPDIIKIARVRNDEYYANSAFGDSGKDKRELYGINYMIHPDNEAAETIVAAFEHGAVAQVMEFEDSTYEMVTLEVEKNSKLAGCTMQKVRGLVDCSFLIPVISRGKTSLLPRGDTVLEAGDKFSLLIEKSNLVTFLKLAGLEEKTELKSVALVGAGKIGTSVAEEILKRTGSTGFFGHLFGKTAKPKVKLVIIEKDKNLAKLAAARFPEARVYNADISDESFIEDENLRGFDLVITATRNHELNIVTSAYFKAQGCPKGICLVTSGSMASIARNIGIDVAVPIKDAVVDSILSHLRGKSVTGIHTLSEGLFEVVELEISDQSKMCGVLLKDLRVADASFLIMLIGKEKNYEIANGNSKLEAGNKVVLIANVEDTQKVLAAFGG